MNDNRTAPVSPLAALAADLRRLAAPVVPDLDPSAAESERLGAITGFRDELGHRRSTDTPLLARLLGVHPGAAPAGLHPDAALWWSLHDHSLDPVMLIESSDGPLVPSLRRLGVEVWSEGELAALHALSWHVLGTERPGLAARVESAARWHLAELQPDNATNRPWAVHVFADLANRTGDASARAHVGTLVHNSIVSLGRPDRLSAAILLDAADWLARRRA
ncbi:MAG TPA: hypothetical protein PLU35_09595 [Phycisphaerales bacterium]|nr:hypothetical protein [Phycisphaerales bacterium]